MTGLWSRALILGTHQGQEVTSPQTDSDSLVVWGAGHASAIPEITTVAQIGAALETGNAIMGGRMHWRSPTPTPGMTSEAGADLSKAGQELPCSRICLQSSQLWHSAQASPFTLALFCPHIHVDPDWKTSQPCSVMVRPAKASKPVSK